MPKISILMPTYNGARTIGRAVESVLCQDYIDWELLVLIDASLDETEQIIKRYAECDSRIRIIVNEKNLRLPKTLNIGIGLSTGRYIARLDDDDVWSDHSKLGRQINFFESREKCSLLGTCFKVVNAMRQETILSSEICDDHEIRKNILSFNPFCHSSVIFKKTDVIKVGLYNDNLNYTEDWDLWLRLGQIGKLFILDEIMVEYLAGAGMSKNNTKKSQIKFHSRILLKYSKYYPGKIRAFIYLIKYAIFG